jgi:hypothetical protein
MHTLHLNPSSVQQRRNALSIEEDGGKLLTLESTIARARNCIVAADSEGTVLAMSQPAIDMLGYDKRRIYGLPAAQFLPALNGTPLAAMGYNRKSLGVCADGSVLHLTVSAIRLSVTDFDGWVLVLRALEATGEMRLRH